MTRQGENLQSGYKLVKLAGGVLGVHSCCYGETMHPGLGPSAEAEALYVRQLRLSERLKDHSDQFVIWDVGLGAAANALTVLGATRGLSCPIRMVSFDNTAEPLAFALAHKDALGYFDDYENAVQTLLDRRRVKIQDGGREIEWSFELGDFPAMCAALAANYSVRAAPEQSSVNPSSGIPKPHAIMFDAFSPARNPAMWTLALFSNLHRVVESGPPCSLATYSRSTMLRVTLLLAGFLVGRGQATGPKEETTVASNSASLIEAPLDQRWLERARRSQSAEPLGDGGYRQAPLSQATWEKLRQAPQFQE